MEKQTPESEVLFELADLFKVFGDSTRLRIMYALSEDEKNVLSIAEELGMEQSTISHQQAGARQTRGKADMVLSRRRSRQENHRDGTRPRIGVSTMKHTYILENLNCAHCAGKIEQAIAETDGYENVSFNFATKQLRFASKKDDTLEEIQAICDSIEDGVTVKDEAEHDHGHGEESSRTERILLIIGLVFGAAALVLHLFFESAVSNYVILGLSLAATLLAGWKVFVKGLKNLLKFRIEETVLMTIAVIAAFILGEYVEGAMVTLLFTVGELIEDYAVDSSRRDIEKLSSLRPDTAVIYADGKEAEVAAESVAIGSTVLVKPHARIPLDGIIIEGTSSIDNAALTGESLPVSVKQGDEVLSGGVNGDSLLKIRTTKAAGDSTAARILQIVENAAARKGQSEKLISRFAAVYTPIVVGLAFLIALLPPLFGLASLNGFTTRWSCWSRPVPARS